MKINLGEGYDLDVERDLIGKRIGIFGVPGSGKSNAVKLIAAGLATLPQRIPLTIIDPEGEYWPLKEVADFILIGKEEQADLICDEAQAAILAQQSVEHGLSVILSLVHLKRDQMLKFVEVYLNALWEALIKNPRPYFLIVEEAHEFAPQSRPSATKDILIQFGKRARKRGGGMIPASQRPQAVDKELISQMNMFILGNVGYADMDVYKAIVPLKPAEVEARTQALAVGQFMIVRGKDVETVQIAKAPIFDAGATPGFETSAAPVLRAVDSAMLKELAALLDKQTTPTEDPEKKELRSRVAELERVNDDLVADRSALLAEVDRLKASVTTLGAIRIVVDHNGGAAGSVPQPVPAPAVAAAGPAKKGPVKRAAQPQQLPLMTDVEDTPPAAAIARAQSRFAAMLRDIEQTSDGVARSVAHYLLKRDSEWFTVRHICRVNEYAESTVRAKHHQAQYMFQIGMLEKSGVGDQAKWRSNVRSYLEAQFPSLDADTLIKRLQDMLEPKRK